MEESPPDFRYERERLKSFYNKSWSVPFLSREELAAVGFVYCGKDDIVRCAFCKVYVGSWVEGDIPLNDHKRFSPRCPFLRNVPVGNVPLSSDEPPSEVEYRKCRLCYIEDMNCVLLPCKHLFNCEKCASLISCCPICRGKIETSLKIYLP